MMNMKTDKYRSIHQLVIYLNYILGHMRIFMLIMFIGGFLTILLNIDSSHKKNTERWTEVFYEDLNKYSRIARMSIPLAGNEASVVFSMDLNGNIIDANSESLLGFNLKNSSIFNKVNQLKSSEELITLDYGLTENRLKAYYILRLNGEYRVINYLPEDFFPLRSFDTKFVILNRSKRVIYSTEQIYIGQYFPIRSFFYKKGRIYISDQILVQNSDIQELYILRDISEQLLISIGIGLVFFIGLIFLNHSLVIIKNNLNLLKNESLDLNESISNITRIDSNPKTLEEGYIRLINQSLRDILIDLIKCKLSFKENKTTRECLKKLIHMLSNLLEKIENVMIERSETEKKYRKVFEHNRDGIFQFSPDGELLMVNQALVTLFGLNNTADLKFYLSGDRFNVIKKDHLTKLLNLSVEEILEETILTKPDGTNVPVLLSAYTIKDIDGELQFIQGNVRDLSAEQNAKNLRLEKDRLEAISKAKSDFLANISHELRTPLNSVIGFSELLDATVKEEKQRSYVKAILTSGKSLLTLIKDILDLSKLEADKMVVDMGSTNIKKLLLEIEQVFAVKIRDKSLEYKTVIDDTLPEYIISDEAKIRQILINLVGNAIKFTDSGFIHVSASFSENNKLQLEVKDSGRGISETGLKNVFSEFHQEGLQHGIGGTGLGLPICKRLSEVINGSLTVKSELGKGSQFNLQLNDVVVDHSIKESNSSETLGDDSFTHIRFKNQRVLIVDDEEFNRDLIREALQMVNLEVITASNGKDGIEISREIKPDLILLDLKMPVMDGFEAITILNKDEELKEIPVLAFTASISEHQFGELDSYGFKGLLLKPVKMGKLLYELCKYLKHTKLNSQNIIQTSEPLKLKLNTVDYSYIMDIWPKEGLFKLNELSDIHNRLKYYIDVYGDNLKVYLNDFDKAVQNFDIEEINKLLKQITLTQE